ncbi:hypothetical protein [Frondihabitans sucicola]|uniref:hypothetical protein n=1 Tax=Frondihabitans sucicola TaxID=1268041 RepID=UPI0025746EB5|nr:hypothetical protein [Frondihabitans sucicola]
MQMPVGLLAVDPAVDEVLFEVGLDVADTGAEARDRLREVALPNELDRLDHADEGLVVGLLGGGDEVEESLVGDVVVVDRGAVVVPATAALLVAEQVFVGDVGKNCPGGLNGHGVLSWRRPSAPIRSTSTVHAYAHTSSVTGVTVASGFASPGLSHP